MSTTVPSAPASEAGAEARGPVFVTTQWSVVLAAAQSDTTKAQAALENLCRTYGYPIYHFASPGDVAGEMRHLFRVLSRR